MSRRSCSSRSRRSSQPHRARRAEAAQWPQGPVETSYGTVELAPDIDGSQVMVLLDGVESSHLNLVDPTALAFEYMQHMQATISACFPPEDQSHGLRALHLGAAGCAMARAIDAAWSGSQQVAVEIDALLAERVREWFDLPRSPRLRLRVGDARQTVRSPGPARYDVIIRDAFADRQVPAHLRTVEFTREVATKLIRDNDPGGVYLANVADRPPLPLARREVSTLAEVFEHVAIIADPSVLRGRRYGNVVLVGSTRPLPDETARRLRSLPAAARLVVGSAARDFARGYSPEYDPEPAAGSDARATPGINSEPASKHEPGSDSEAASKHEPGPPSAHGSRPGRG